MFYVKEKLSDSSEIKIDITDENVYCRCPKCGAEVHIDLEDFIDDEEFDIYATSVYCDECAVKVRNAV